jgi:putative zinc finger protein
MKTRNTSSTIGSRRSRNESYRASIRENEMVKKSAHPDIQLFDYLNGAAETETVKAIEEHLSMCEDCTSLAALVGKLKQAASSEPTPESSSRASHPVSHVSAEHPDTNELASFFYAKSRSAGSPRVAIHVALCNSCTEAIAQYARAEHIASEYKPAKAAPGEMPAKAWEMIGDWEDSSFAQLKPAREVLGEELLSRLFSLFDARTPQVSERTHEVSRSQDAGRIPVLVVTRSGEVRGVEFFEGMVDSAGVKVLKHAEGSQRFDNRLVHALLDYGEKEPVLISELIRSDTLRLEHAPREEDKLLRVGYFIIEESRD